MNSITTNARRKMNSNVAKKIETQRRKLEGMGLDCKFATELMKNGVTEEELHFLAKKNIPTFLKKAGSKLTAEQQEHLREKY